MEKLDYAQFLSSLEEEECRALTEEALLTRSRSRERAAEAQLLRRVQKPKRRVVLSTTGTRSSGRPLAEQRYSRRRLTPEWQ